MIGETRSEACRACRSSPLHSVVDLGLQPLANSYLTEEELAAPEPRYPLHPFVCDRCWLMQLGEFATPGEIFSEYAYFSSYSESWLAHARRYAEEMVARLSLDGRHRVIEVASNDGYLLRNFVERDIPVLGIEPARNVAEEAIRRGVPTEQVFLGERTAGQLLVEHEPADLLVGNNVLAHVPDLDDFVLGLKALLAPKGTLTMEFPHLLHLIEQRQFDTIYHEHFSYFSLLAARAVFGAHGLVVFDVEELPTHGGSLRIFARHEEASPAVEPRVSELLERESAAGLDELGTFERFGGEVDEVRSRLLDFLREAKRDGKKVVAYGAPAKGNTLLNFCGISTDLVAFTADISPHKQGRYLPGSRLPIHSPEHLLEARPDYVLVLPWNIVDEIVRQLAAVRSWGGRFVVPIPEPTVVA